MSLVDFYINPQTISIFSKTTCGFCVKAKTLLENEYPTSQIQVIELDYMKEGAAIGMELRRKTGQTTVPNIFVFGKHIGGYTELKQLHDHGILRKLIYEQNTVIDVTFVEKTLLQKNCLVIVFTDVLMNGEHQIK